MWQNINLSGFGLVRWWQEDREHDHTGPQSKVPALPLVLPWGVTYLTKARQVTQMSSAAYYIPMALLLGTICSFVSMSPNHIFLHKMVKMLYRLFSLQTKLLISFHHQSDVLLHQGTPFGELLLSSQIRNAMEKIWPKVNLTEVVTHLAMRCLYWGLGWGGVLREYLGSWGTLDQRSTWPTGSPNVKLTQSSITLGH